MESKVKENRYILNDYVCSMDVAVKKAIHGSDVEDAYFMEKLGKAARVMGFDLVERK